VSRLDGSAASALPSLGFMAPTSFAVSGRDGTPLATYRWEPAGPVRGVVQIVHGLGEHVRRYDHLANTLAGAGFLVQGHDTRGHGGTIASGAEPGVIGAEGWKASIDDIDVLLERLRNDVPGVPVVLLGHSMGSFAVQQYLVDNSDHVEAVVLSGTAAADLMTALDLDAPLDLSGFNAPFEPARTGYEWLTRDEAQVDAYVADPLCGFGYDVPASKAVYAGACAAADPQKLARIRHDLPIYIVVGDQDPVGNDLAGVHALVHRYRNAGLADVELRVHPGARHEVFNETNRDEVERNLLRWLGRVVPPAQYSSHTS
jgi:alpha-beta hydrolase superfamily lysophospholipase